MMTLARPQTSELFTTTAPSPRVGATTANTPFCFAWGGGCAFFRSVKEPLRRFCAFFVDISSKKIWFVLFSAETTLFLVYTTLAVGITPYVKRDVSSTSFTPCVFGVCEDNLYSQQSVSYCCHFTRTRASARKTHQRLAL